MKKKAVTILLGVCIITTLLIGCGNSKTNSTEVDAEKGNSTEALIESESEIETEADQTEIETETETTQPQDTEVKDAETKVEDNTSPEQSGDNPQNNNTPSNNNSSSNSNDSTSNQQQNGNNNNSTPSDETWTDANGNILSSNPELCSHAYGGYTDLQTKRIRVGDIVEQYDSGAYLREKFMVFKKFCMTCDGFIEEYEDPNGHIRYIDKVTDYAREFEINHTPVENYGFSRGDLYEREKLGKPSYTGFYPDNYNELGAVVVKYAMGLISKEELRAEIEGKIDVGTDDYKVICSFSGDYVNGDNEKIRRETLIYGDYNNLCVICYGGGNMNFAGGTGLEMADDTKNVEVWIFRNWPN